ncbi:uncharacterized protein LOC144717837 [Lampetra planeri]
MLLQQERHPRRQCICVDSANPDETNVYDVIVLGKNEPIIPQLIFPRKPLTAQDITPNCNVLCFSATLQDASLPPSPPLFGVMVSKNATLAPQGGDGGGGGATRLMVEEVIFGSTFPPSLPTATVLPAARTAHLATPPRLQFSSSTSTTTTSSLSPGDAFPPPPPSSDAPPVTTDRSDERGSSSATSRGTVAGAATTRGRDLDSSTSNRTAEFQPTPPTMIGR